MIWVRTSWACSHRSRLLGHTVCLLNVQILCWLGGQDPRGHHPAGRKLHVHDEEGAGGFPNVHIKDLKRFSYPQVHTFALGVYIWARSLDMPGAI